MLTVDEALARCMEAVRPVQPQVVPLAQALGRVLAQDLVSQVQLPPWDNSAMDGYAVIAADLSDHAHAHDDGPDPCAEGDRPSGPSTTLRVLETIAAGEMGTHRVVPGTTSAIMTGAPMPQGADAVVMREDAERLDGDTVRLTAAPRVGQHVRRAGEDVRPGEPVLPAGTVLDPSAVGVCAALGCATVTVARRPRVAIIATGDEVVPPGQPLEPGQIWSSNTAALMGMVVLAGGEPIDCGIAPDSLDGTRQTFRRALATGCDVLVSTGGVSVGDFDVVKQAMADEGAEMGFWKVAMKPGKPLAFGIIGGRPAFGLPGNPVSCLVNFLQFVRPVLRASLGDPRPFLPVVDAVLKTALRRRTGRAELVRVSLAFEGGQLVATSTGAQGSGRVTSMARAHGFALLDADTAELPVGAPVPVQIFDPGFLAGPTPDYRWA